MIRHADHVSALTPREISLAVRRLSATRPHVSALSILVNRDELARLCRSEFNGVDLQRDGWDIRPRFWGVVICQTPRLGRLQRGITIEWRTVAEHVSAERTVT